MAPSSAYDPWRQWLRTDATMIADAGSGSYWISRHHLPCHSPDSAGPYISCRETRAKQIRTRSHLAQQHPHLACDSRHVREIQDRRGRHRACGLRGGFGYAASLSGYRPHHPARLARLGPCRHAQGWCTKRHDCEDRLQRRRAVGRSASAGAVDMFAVMRMVGNCVSRTCSSRVGSAATISPYFLSLVLQLAPGQA